MPTTTLLLKGSSSSLNLEVYPLEINKKNITSDSPWHSNIRNFNPVQDEIISDSNIHKRGYDLCFKYNNTYYLTPWDDSLSDVAFYFMGSYQIPWAWVSPSYRERVIEIPQPPQAYKPGWVLTGAPAMAGAMTLAPMASAGLVKVGVPSVLNAPLIFPMLAGMFTYVLTFASNWVAYRLTHKGAAPDLEEFRKMHHESKLRAGQISVGFFLCEATRVLFEKACGSVLEEAWGGVMKVGGTLCPAEIKAAVMVSVGLAVGIGATLVFGAWQYWNNKKSGAAFDWTLLPVVFLTGFTAGAVSTIEFSNKGFSFLATWAALSLFPIYNTVRPEGRKALKDSCTETKKCFFSMGHAMGGKSSERRYDLPLPRGDEDESARAINMEL